MISVALATYNGEKYIVDQILSILSQTLLPSEIIIVDDNSTDNTFKLLESLAHEHSFIRIYKNEYNLGVTKNFEKAISLCQYNYIALSDQDDVWRKNKLEQQFEAISRAEQLEKKALLVVHDLEVVDDKLNNISKSFLEYTGLNKIGNKLDHLMIWNRNPGCTMLFNRELKNLILPIPSNCLMHDHWISIVACTQSRIISIDLSLLLYRQHESNLTETQRFKLSNYIKVLRFSDREYLIKEIQQVESLYFQHYDILSENLKMKMTGFIKLKNHSFIIRKVFVMICRILK